MGMDDPDPRAFAAHNPPPPAAATAHNHGTESQKPHRHEPTIDPALVEMAVQAEKAPPLQTKPQSMGGSNFGQVDATSRSYQSTPPFGFSEAMVNPSTPAADPMPALPDLHEDGLNSIEKQGWRPRRHLKRQPTTKT